DVHGVPFMLPLNCAAQNGPIGSVKAQLARPASGGIGGKGAARRMMASASSSRLGEPELLTRRTMRTSPPAPTTNDTSALLRALSCAARDMVRATRRSLAAILPG